MANTYDIGDSITLAAAFTSGGVATNPTTITFKLKTPAGAVTTYEYGTDAELVRDSTGNFHVAYVPAASGRYVWRFVGDGAIEAAEESIFFVRESEF